MVLAEKNHPIPSLPKNDHCSPLILAPRSRPLGLADIGLSDDDDEGEDNDDSGAPHDSKLCPLHL